MLAFCQLIGIAALAPQCSSPYATAPILLYTKGFLLACRPGRSWHKNCPACWGRRRDGQDGRSCVSDCLPAQPSYGLCFDDEGTAAPWDT
jgi:hypothetical protein